MKLRVKQLLSLLAVVVGASEALAAGGVAKTVNWYEIFLHSVHIDHKWEATLGSIACSVLILIAGIKYRTSVSASGETVGPTGRFGLRFMVESILDMVLGVAKDNAAEQYRKFFPLLSALFIYILVCNLSGLIPGFPPPTEQMANNVAVGIVVFVVYNAAGLKEHGFGYVKHFLGPVAFIAPLFFCIELFSHFSRPLSLGLRLTGNIYGDHTLLGVFTSITYIIFPALLTFFGLLVAVVQSFVFTLLSGIYISMAISHDH